MLTGRQKVKQTGRQEYTIDIISGISQPEQDVGNCFLLSATVYNGCVVTSGVTW